MKKPKKKLTYKEMLGVIAGMDKMIQEQQMVVFNVDKLLQEYIDYKKKQNPSKNF